MEILQECCGAVQAMEKREKYNFTYDASNRILKANFTQLNAAGTTFDNSAGFDYSVIMGDGATPTTAYDANGNIIKLSLKRI